jgi:hypothetical protein
MSNPSHAPLASRKELLQALRAALHEHHLYPAILYREAGPLLVIGQVPMSIRVTGTGLFGWTVDGDPQEVEPRGCVPADDIGQAAVVISRVVETLVAQRTAAGRPAASLAPPAPPMSGALAHRVPEPAGRPAVTHVPHEVRFFWAAVASLLSAQLRIDLLGTDQEMLAAEQRSLSYTLARRLRGELHRLGGEATIRPVNWWATIVQVGQILALTNGQVIAWIRPHPSSRGRPTLTYAHDVSAAARRLAAHAALPASGRRVQPSPPI